jgi:hypothetical protein
LIDPVSETFLTEKELSKVGLDYAAFLIALGLGAAPAADDGREDAA